MANKRIVAARDARSVMNDRIAGSNKRISYGDRMQSVSVFALDENVYVQL
jgi:hypothetical protein